MRVRAGTGNCQCDARFVGKVHYDVPASQRFGPMTHYFRKAQMTAVKVTDGQLTVGDTVHVVGHTSYFTQKVKSMQIEDAPEHDRVYHPLPD